MADAEQYERWEKEHPALRQETIKRLMAQGCGIPNCDHKHDELLYLHPQCHLRGKIDCAYFRGSIYVSCRVCGTFVVRLKVVEEAVN